MNARPSTALRSGNLEDTRQRLLRAALRLFAQQGFAQTSTRELAEAAQANVAAISYHFGDKAGLYRAAFLEPLGAPGEDLARLQAAAGSLDATLDAFYAGFLAPLHEGEAAQWCMRLHYREWLEPTGLWEQTLRRTIEPMHQALLGVLQRALGLPQPDEDLQRLAILLTAPGVYLHMGHEVNRHVAPGLLDGPAALDRWRESMVQFGHAMVAAEAARRGLSLHKDLLDPQAMLSSAADDPQAVGLSPPARTRSTP